MLRNSSTRSTPTAVTVPTSSRPVPTTTPMAAVAKIADAVVMPRTNEFPVWKTTPAPMNPMPVMAPASAWGDDLYSAAVRAAVAAPMRAKVRSPAG